MPGGIWTSTLPTVAPESDCRNTAFEPHEKTRKHRDIPVKTGENRALKNFNIERTMLRLGNQVRLTPKEIERLTKITGFEPVNVRTLRDLDAFVAACKRHYWGVSRDTRFLHWLIDKERSRCIGDR
jgi:hypothetical protein